MILTLVAFFGLGYATEQFIGPPEVKEIPMADITEEQQEEVWKELEELD